MTEPLDPQLERQISRCLDGEATPQEESDLKRELLRNPDARRRMEEYRRFDEAAANALRAVVELPSKSPHSGTRRRRLRVWSGGWSLGVAASVLLVVGLSTFHLLEQHSGTQTKLGPSPRPTGPRERPFLSFPSDDPSALHPVVAGYQPETPYRKNRQVERDLFVIHDEQANAFYLLERDRTRTVIVPAGGDL